MDGKEENDGHPRIKDSVLMLTKALIF